jgi:hypothetical protein
MSELTVHDEVRELRAALAKAEQRIAELELEVAKAQDYAVLERELRERAQTLAQTRDLLGAYGPEEIRELRAALSAARAALRDIPTVTYILKLSKQGYLESPWDAWCKKHAPAIKAAREAE